MMTDIQNIIMDHVLTCPDLSDTGTTQGCINLKLLVKRNGKIQSCINPGELKMFEMSSWFAMDLEWKPVSGLKVLNDK